MNREHLINAGVDYDGGVNRFGGMPELYEKYLIKFFNGDLMKTLEENLRAKEYGDAFKTVHDLKGAAGNLSLNQLYDKFCELTELLRGGEPADDYSQLLNQIWELYDRIYEAVKVEQG